MKYLYFLLVLFCINSTSGQNVAPANGSDTDIVRLRLDENSVVLREGWRMNEGLNDEWLSDSYDDTHWKSIDPGENIKDLGLFNSTTPITLRLRFILEDPMPDSLFLCVTQSVASKVYLNGLLLPSGVNSRGAESRPMRLVL